MANEIESKNTWSKKLQSMPFIYAFNWINELRQLCIKTSWSTLIQNLFFRGPAVVISWTPWLWSNPSDFRWSSDQNAVLMLTLTRDNKSQYEYKKKLEKKLLKLVSGQTSVLSNRPLIRLVCAWYCLWSDRPRTKWPLIRQVPDHCPDKSALEAFSRTCNSSAPQTCVRSKPVWSGVTSVWPPQPGYSQARRQSLFIEDWIRLFNLSVFECLFCVARQSSSILNVSAEQITTLLLSNILLHVFFEF